MRITGFGDYLIHFSPMGDERFLQANSMQMSYTGAEANVCAALSLWGKEVSFVTRLPEHPLAQKGIMFLNSLGINTRHIARGGKRMGLYFLEKGASVRSAQVIYDRMGSGITEAVPSDFDIGAIMEDTDLLYLTGITPALTENLADCTLALCKAARERGIQVAFDVNYRPTLSSPEQAGAVLKKLAPYITLLIGNEEHLKMLLGVSTEFGEDEREARLYDLIGQVRAVLGIEKIAVTVRRTPSASDAVIYAAYSDGKEFAVSAEHKMHVVDRVGSGDAFSAGLVYALSENWPAAEAVGFAAASNAFKHTVLSDVNYASVDEIARVMKQAGFDVKR